LLLNTSNEHLKGERFFDSLTLSKRKNFQERRMLDLRFVRENPEKVRWAIQVKRVDLDLDELLNVDQAVLKLKRQIQALNEEKNTNSKKMGKATAEERPQIIL